MHASRDLKNACREILLSARGIVVVLAAMTTVLPLINASAAPCNKAAAQDVQLGIREFAKWQFEGDHLKVNWTYAIEKLPEAKRLQMITTYSNMDACLGGAAREIMFYRKGKLMGIASPASGIRLIK